MTVSISGTNGVTFPDGTVQTTTGKTGMVNRIINGAMVIDQRNAGATGTATNYTVDRWQYIGSQASKGTWGRNLNSVTPPAGFTNYLGFQSSSSYSVASTDYFGLYQPVEGYNIADLAWGTASAATVTLSFWVYSSLTGTFGGILQNSGATLCYAFTYSIASANTWTKISVTITGPTSGTWNTTTGGGVYLNISLGAGTSAVISPNSWTVTSSPAIWSASSSVSVVGTNGATFYITGVQLEKGSTATSFDYRPYGQEVINCYRYYQMVGGYCVGQNNSSTAVLFSCVVPTLMRSTPTVTLLASSWISTDYQCLSNNTWIGNSSPTISNPFYDGITGININLNGFSGLSTGISTLNIPGKFIGLSAEL